jgi:hypothetical protein
MPETAVPILHCFGVDRARLHYLDEVALDQTRNVSLQLILSMADTCVIIQCKSIAWQMDFSQRRV